MRPPGILTSSISSLLLLGVFNAMRGTTQAATRTWDGGGGGGSELGLAINWSEDTLPDVTAGDTALWNGTVAGPLSLIYSNDVFAGVEGSVGLNLSVASTQAEPLNIDSGANTSSLRLNNITLAAGAGAFSLGDGAGVFNLTLGGASGQTHTWTNDSSATASLASDVVLSLGGGGPHTLALGGAGNWTFNNVLSNGGGTLSISKGGSGALTLTGANTYTGGLTLDAGTLNLNNAAAAGNTAAGAITINGGTLDNTSGAAITTTTAKAMIWNGDFTFAGSNNLSTNLGAVTIGGAAGSRTVTVANGVLSTGLWNSAAGIGLTKAGAGTLFMAATPNTSNLGGTLHIEAGKVQVAGDLTMGGLTGSGTIENGGPASKWIFVANAADNTFSGNILGNAGNPGVRLGLVKNGTGTLTLTGTVGSPTTGADTFEVRNGRVVLTNTAVAHVGGNNFGQLGVGTVNGQNGILEINGATVNSMRTGTPMINIGTAAGARGFVTMTSGTINTASSTVGELWISNNATSFGEFTMSGGTVNTGNWIAVGRNGPGILNISGGTINVATNPYTHGSFGGSTGVTNLSGTGAINVNSAGAVGMYLAEGGNGTLNMTGGTLTVATSATNGLNLTNAAGSGTANLNGGILTAAIVRKIGAGNGLLNFGGGTLRANASSGTFMEGLTSAYINPGGATIDSNGFNITVGQPLLAPTGNGITGIAVGDGGAGYIDAPLVTISGGSGRGATAVATVSGGVVTGITITNPGVDFSPDDVLTVNLVGGGATTPAAVGPVTFGANVSGGLTKTGAGRLTLSGSSTYAGPTSVTGGELHLSSTGDVNGSSGVTVNGTGAKLVQTSFTPLTSPVTLSDGILDGTGSINAVTVTDGTGGRISNGDGTAVPLTIGTLTFNGAATLNLTAVNQSASLITETLTTGATNANGKVTINVTNLAGNWTPGVYNLISYSVLSGQGAAGFERGAVPNLGARQSATLTNPDGNIALTIGGDFPVWTGAENGNWTTATIGGASNWKLQAGNTPTDFIDGDTVLFDDSASGTTTVNISTANVSPTTTTFDNANREYVITSSGSFGIAGGSLLKKGAGRVVLGTANTYAGGTTLNEGTLVLNNASAIGTGTLTINGGTIDSVTGAPITLSTNNAQVWAGDFAFGGSADLNLGTGPVSLTGDRVITSNAGAALTVGGVISGAGFSINSSGPGNLVLAGANTYTGPTDVNGGTITVTGSINAASVPNAGPINAENNGTLRIAGGTVNATLGTAPAIGAGNISGSNGAIFVESGTLNVTQELWLGSPSGGFGGFTSNGGSVTTGNWFAVGRSGTGVVNVNGGAVTVNGQNLVLASFTGALGVATLTGGTTSITSVAANQGAFIVGEAGTGELNVMDTAAVNISGGLGVNIARVAGGVGTVNLNGGTITTPAVTKGAGASAIFNFDGGTLRPTAANTAFMTGLNEAYVFDGGAKIDTNGQNITIAQPLLAPAGSGVTSVTVADGGAGYIHPPVIRLSGGTGNGATAVPTISGGKVTGITITNPGTGYAPDDLLFASVEGGGATTPATVGGITLAPNTSGGLTKLGAGTLTLSGANTYSGVTAVSAGTLQIGGGGSINNSSAINIEGVGARLVQANSATPVMPTVNVTTGALDGTGTVNTVIVGDGTGGIITNGNGGTGILTIGSLTFTGAGAVNINTAGSVGLAVTDALTASGVETITLNVPVGLPWATGETYDLISYGTLNGGIESFVTGSIAGLGARQTPTPVIRNNNIAIVINGDTPIWTGAASGAWTTAAVGAPSNWKLQIAQTPTEFLPNDQVIFDDSASGTTAITISDATVSPASVTFNNSAKSYTVSGAFGINSGLLLKNGTGAVTISTANSYTGGTTVNSGTLVLSGNNNFGTGAITVNGGALTISGSNTYTGLTTLNAGGTLNVDNATSLGSSVLTINGGTLGNTSGAAITLANANAQNWNGDFTFAGPGSLSFNNGAVTIGGAAGQRTVNVAAGTLSTGLITSVPGIGLTKTGAGTLAMTSTANTSLIDGLLEILAGTLQIAGDLNVNGGLAGAGTIENGGPGSKWLYLMSPGDTTFSGTIRDNPNNAGARLGLVKRGLGTLNLTGENNTTTDRFAIENGTVRITGTYTAGFGAGANQAALIGSIGSQTGSLVIDGGTFNANKTNAPSLNLGAVANSQGVLRMSSGTINAANELWVGSAAYGAFTMSGGTVNTGSWLAVGRNGTGVAEISGGTVNVNGANYTIGSFGGANGVTNLSGGTINTLSTAPDAGGFLVAEGGNGTLNLSGTGALNISGSRGLHLGINGGTGIANLNGGTVTTPIVQRGTSPAFVNFNGGTLRASGPNANFMGGFDAAHVNAGGAVIDDGGFEITIAQPLLAPVGDGVSSIEFIPGGGYAGAPIVQIFGDGVGATAVANIDANGNLSGFTITNPGTGYTLASATLLGGGGTATVDAVNLAPNSSGGLTKQGSGTLTLDGENTYTGPTVVEAGSLALGVSGSISGSTTIQAKAGAVIDGTALGDGFVLATGQTLTGSGGVTGNLAAAEGSKLAPGDAIGTLTFAGDLSLSLAVSPVGSAALLFELAAPEVSDRVAFATGGLAIGNGVLGFDDFGFTTLPGFGSGDYTLFDGNTAISGALDSANLSGSLGGGFTGTLAFSDGGNDLVLMVVPEPASATMLLVGAGSLLGLRRFRGRAR